jgi:hypothetical protein
MTDTLPTMTHPLLLHGDCIADVFEKMDMAPKARKCEHTVANYEESMSLSTTCPATPQEHPGSPASRSCSPGGSKRGRDDTVVQEESDLSLVSRKLQRMILSGEKNILKLEIMIPDAYEEDEGTDFDWLCPEACFSA